jgi:hypothetical protein
LKAVEELILSSDTPFHNSDLLSDDDKKTLLSHLKVVEASDSTLKSLKDLLAFPILKEVQRASGSQNGDLIGSGYSGAYFLKEHTGATCAVFKPDDEAIGEQGNPKGLRTCVSKETGISPEKYSRREEAASLMDRGFSLVPQTRKVTLRSVTLNSRKRSVVQGSLQAFIPGAREFGQLTEKEKQEASAEDLRKIAIQDLRWLNADRHFGNLLVNESGRIIPIDHGLILPNNSQRLVFGWMTLPQIDTPLSLEEKEYILALNPEKDARLLKRNEIEKPAIERMKIATRLLQLGVEKGLNLYEIGQIFLMGPNPFAAAPNRTNASYFEHAICQKILLKQVEYDALLSEIITYYLDAKNDNLSNPKNFSARGWKKGEQIAKGITYFHYTGAFQGKPQKVHVVKIEVTEQHRYQLKVVDHRQFSESDAKDPRKPLKDTFSLMPDVLAGINGSFFHYSKSHYVWNLEKYEIGDPVGFLKVSGQPAMVASQSESKNPCTKLWGTVAIGANGQVDVVKTGRKGREIIAHEAIGSGPVLLRNGEPVHLDQKIQALFEKKRKWFGDRSKFDTPGDFIMHYNKPHPRSCFGKDKDGSWYMVLVDGRNSGAKGMT